MTEKTQFLGSCFPGSAETLARGVGITNHHLISYSLSNISAKKYQNRLMCVEVIVCYIIVVFLRHGVEPWHRCSVMNSAVLWSWWLALQVNSLFLQVRDLMAVGARLGRSKMAMFRRRKCPCWLSVVFEMLLHYIIFVYMNMTNSFLYKMISVFLCY